MAQSLLHILQEIENQPAKWRCVHPLFRDEQATARSPKFSNWLKSHSHQHKYREIMVALAGNAFYGIGQDIATCRPGNIIFLESIQPHQCGYPPFSAACDHLWIGLIAHHFSALIVSVRNGKPLNSSVIKYFKSYPEIGVWFDRCWPEKRPPELSPALYRTRLLNALSILLADIIQTALLPPRADQHATRVKQIIKAVQDHIWKTGGRDASLVNLSQIAGYSKYHFLRLFKKATGQTVHSFVNMARLNAYHELAKAQAGRKQMADQLGFSCPAAFSRWLRQTAV
jgi:AraC-like DNA-binding protein